MRNKEDRLGAKQNMQDNDMQVNFSDSSKNDNLNFIIPTEIIDLPSRGLFYPSDHPLYKQETLEIKQMTAKEEDILTSKSLLKKGLALDRLIQAVIVDKSINADSLTLSDRNAIIIASRISGYGHEYLTQVTCPACTEKSKYKFNLLETSEKQKDTSLAAEIDDSGLFTFELPVTKWKVICRALNGFDEKTISRSLELKKKNNSLNDSMLFEQLKSMTLAIQGVTDKQVIEKALNSMPAKDSKYMRTVYQHTVPDVNLTRAFLCQKCDYEVDMEVPLTADFFWFE